MPRLGKKFKTIEEVENFYKTPTKKYHLNVEKRGYPVSPERIKDFYTFLGVPENQNGKYYTFTDKEFKQAALKMLKTIDMSEFAGLNYDEIIRIGAYNFLCGLIYNLAGQNNPKEANIMFVSLDKNKKNKQDIKLDMNLEAYKHVEYIVDNITEKEIKNALYEGLMKTSDALNEIKNLEDKLPKLENDFLTADSDEIKTYINDGMKKRSYEDFEMNPDTKQTIRNLAHNLRALHQKNNKHGFLWRLFHRNEHSKDVALEKKIEDILRKYGMESLINKAKDKKMSDKDFRDFIGRDEPIEKPYLEFVYKSCDKYKEQHDLEESLLAEKQRHDVELKNINEKNIKEAKKVMDEVKLNNLDPLETINKKINNLDDVSEKHIKNFYINLRVYDMNEAKKRAFTKDEFISAGLKTLSTVDPKYFEKGYSNYADFVKFGSKDFLYNLLCAVSGAGENLKYANSGLIGFGENNQVEFFNNNLFDEISNAINEVSYDECLGAMKNGAFSYENLSDKYNILINRLPDIKDGILTADNTSIKNWMEKKDLDEEILVDKNDIHLLKDAIYDLKTIEDKYRLTKSEEDLLFVTELKNRLSGFGFDDLLDRITDSNHPISFTDLDKEINGKNDIIENGYKNLISKTKEHLYFERSHIVDLRKKLEADLPKLSLGNFKVDNKKQVIDTIHKGLIDLKRTMDYLKNKNDVDVQAMSNLLRKYVSDQLVDDILNDNVSLSDVKGYEGKVTINFYKKLREYDAIQLSNRIKYTEGFEVATDAARDYFLQKKDELKVFANSKMDITGNNLYETQFEKFTFTVTKMAQTLSMFANIMQEREKEGASENVVSLNGQTDVLDGIEDNEILYYIQNLKRTMLEKGFSDDLVDELATGKYDEAKIRDFVTHSILEIQNDKNLSLKIKWTIGKYDIGEKGLKEGVEQLKWERKVANEFSDRKAEKVYEEQKQENAPKEHNDIDMENLEFSNNEIVNKNDVDFIDEYEDEFKYITQNAENKVENEGEERDVKIGDR